MGITAPSRGIKIYGTYAVIVGTLNGVGNLTLAVLAAKGGTFAAVGVGRPLLGALVGGLLATSGIGVARLRPWGRTLAVATAIGIMGLAAFNALHLPAGPSAPRVEFIASYVLFPLALNAGVLWFLTRPPVVAQFSRA